RESPAGLPQKGELPEGGGPVRPVRRASLPRRGRAEWADADRAGDQEAARSPRPAVTGCRAGVHHAAGRLVCHRLVLAPPGRPPGLRSDPAAGADAAGSRSPPPAAAPLAPAATLLQRL